MAQPQHVTQPALLWKKPYDPGLHDAQTVSARGQCSWRETTAPDHTPTPVWSVRLLWPSGMRARYAVCGRCIDAVEAAFPAVGAPVEPEA